VLSLAGVAVAEAPVTRTSGNIVTTLNSDFSPDVLAKEKPTPTIFSISSKIATLDGGHPPALREFLIESDKHLAIDVKGIPTCKRRQLQGDTRQVETACRKALLGGGHVNVQISFPEQPPVVPTNHVRVVNGGSKHGVTTLFIHTYITVPSPAPVVITVKIKEIAKGRYGLRWIATVPEIAGGSGSITTFGFRLGKVIFATCPRDRRLQFQLEPRFVDGTRLAGRVVRPCTPKG
jgi:hypothetical protein